jgi:hypothetical protein
MTDLDLWKRFTDEFRSAIAKVSEERLSLAWSSAKTRTSFYEEMLTPLATNLKASRVRQHMEFNQSRRRHREREKLLLKAGADFDPQSGTSGSFNPNGTTRTFFKPSSQTYFDRQP